MRVAPHVFEDVRDDIVECNDVRVPGYVERSFLPGKLDQIANEVTQPV